MSTQTFIEQSPHYAFCGQYSCLMNRDFNYNSYSSWRHQMETFSVLLAICAGNSPVAGEIPAQRPVTRSFDVFFDLRLNKRLSKQPWGWWFETPSCSLWHRCNVMASQSHRCGHRQAACREPAGSYDKTTRTAICFEHKTQHLLIRAPYTRIVVFWHISKIRPMIDQSQISCNTPTFCIATIFVKYCYTTGSWLL